MTMMLSVLERPLASDKDAAESGGWVSSDFSDDRPTAMDLVELTDGWNGPGTTGPSTTTIATAAMIIRAGIGRPSFGPTDDGEIVFEWESGGKVILAHVNGRDVQIVTLGSEPSEDRDLGAHDEVAAISVLRQLI